MRTCLEEGWWITIFLKQAHYFILSRTVVIKKTRGPCRTERLRQGGLWCRMTLKSCGCIFRYFQETVLVRTERTASYLHCAWKTYGDNGRELSLSRGLPKARLPLAHSPTPSEMAIRGVFSQRKDKNLKNLFIAGNPSISNKLNAEQRYWRIFLCRPCTAIPCIPLILCKKTLASLASFEPSCHT